MKQKYMRVLIVGVIGLLFSLATFAQSNKRTADLYVISAKAGGVNFASGKIVSVGRDGKRGSLSKGDTVAVGDRVSTGADGKLEVLLNPGSFVRLAENSEFEFVSTALDDLQIKLVRGSAVFEVIAANKFEARVITPKTVFTLIKSGVYRVDVTNDQTARIEVWKGKAEIADNSEQTIKGGQSATVTGGQATVAKFNRSDRDVLDLWSKDRAKELAKINETLQNRAMNRSLVSSFSQNQWSLYNNFGLWVQDPFSRNYCFLPFSYGWNSPYGYYYQRDIWSYRLPTQVYYSPSQNGQSNGVVVNNRPPINTPPAGGQPSNGGGFNAPPVYRQPSAPSREVSAPRSEGGKRVPKVD